MVLASRVGMLRIDASGKLAADLRSQLEQACSLAGEGKLLSGPAELEAWRRAIAQWRSQCLMTVHEAFGQAAAVELLRTWRREPVDGERPRSELKRLGDAAELLAALKGTLGNRARGSTPLGPPCTRDSAEVEDAAQSRGAAAGTPAAA